MPSTIPHYPPPPVIITSRYLRSLLRVWPPVHWSCNDRESAICTIGIDTDVVSTSLKPTRTAELTVWRNNDNVRIVSIILGGTDGAYHFYRPSRKTRNYMMRAPYASFPIQLNVLSSRIIIDLACDCIAHSTVKRGV